MITSTLEQSKKLKELGAPQGTCFIWAQTPVPGERGFHLAEGRYDIEWQLLGDFKEIAITMGGEKVSAYTLQELIEWLPTQIDGYLFSFMAFSTKKGSPWGAAYLDLDGTSLYDSTGKTPLEAVYNLTIAVKGQS